VTPARLYCFADLHRAGLGNRLLPWARCKIFSMTNRVPMLATQWIQIPSLSGSIRGDPRTYLGQLRADPAELGWTRSMLIRTSARRVPEDGWPQIDEGRGSRVIVFQGLQPYFAALAGHRELVRSSLLRVTRPRWIKAARSLSADIGIHVRRGDFVTQRTPMDWFVATLAAIRSAVGSSQRVVVVSDGAARDLMPLLRLPGVMHATTGSAIGDLWLLAGSRVLIASSGSTFSAWASFLADVPTVSSPHDPLDLMWIRSETNRYIGSFDPDRPDDGFLDQARSSLIEAG